MQDKGLIRKLIMAVLLFSLFGCSAAIQEKVVYPVPPETARFEWVGTYASVADFRGKFSQFMIGEGGVSGGFFAGVMGVGGDADDRLLVCDLAGQKLRVLDLANQTIENFTSYAFRNPIDVDVDRQGQVYVSDAAAKEVLVFSPEGSLVRTIGSEDVFKKASFLTVNDDLGRLYVSDPLANDIKVFSLEGELLFKFGQRGVEGGAFHVPQGLEFDSSGQLFVADSLNARIQVLSADGEFIRQFGERGTFNHQLEAPKDLAFDSEGHLYVTDSRKPSFRVFDPEAGQLLLMIGGSVTSDHKLGFTVPTGIYVDSQDRVYIGDLMLGRVTVWQYLSEAYKQRVKEAAKQQ
ncbi:hypothetical protein P9J64_05675 [Deltaproteobacteria bacterium IMCC39524]|nr:hypothetical protein [Deltaproteobacteria bacterium IMCC39524]